MYTYSGTSLSNLPHRCLLEIHPTVQIIPWASPSGFTPELSHVLPANTYGGDLSKNHYNMYSGEVERESFVSYHIVSYWRHGQTSFVFYKRLASLLSKNRETAYSTTINRLHCTITYSLLRSAVQSIHGAHSAFHRPYFEAHVDYMSCLCLTFKLTFSLPNFVLPTLYYIAKLN